MFVTPVVVTIEYQQMTDTSLTATRLWKSMTSAQRLAAADAFWRDEDATDDQIQAVMLIAQQKKFRPKSVIALDVDRKARHLASIVNLPEALAARALILYHLAATAPDDGRVSRCARHRARGRPDQGRERRSRTPTGWPRRRHSSDEQFPAEDVSLYLNTLLCQDPETWGGLKEIVASTGVTARA